MAAVTSEYTGPALALNKTHLYMETYTGMSKPAEVTVNNVGTSAVFYEWKKYFRSDYIKAKKSDGVLRFYCHYGKGVLLPGSAMKFVFTFTSARPGVFTEEWDLRTDPLLVHPIAQLVVTGRALSEDCYTAKRFYLEEELVRRTVLHSASEVLRDIVRNVRTPTPPPADLADPKQCQEQFESINLQEKIWFTPEVVQMLQELETKVLGLSEEEELTGSGLSVSALKQLVSTVKDAGSRAHCEQRLQFILKLAKQRPPERSVFWDFARGLVLETSSQIVDLSDSLRHEHDLEEHYFYLPWEVSEEDLAVLRKEKAEKEVVRAKGAKAKKPKTEEEQKKEKDSYLEKLRRAATDALVNSASAFPEEAYYIELWHHLELLHQCNELPKVLADTNRLNKHMKNSNLANYEIFKSKLFRLSQENLGKLARKLTLAEVSLEGKKVMLRAPLDVLLTEVELEEAEEEDETLKRPLPREVLDPEYLAPVVDLIQYCLDHLAKWVIVVGSLGQRAGEFREENSILPVLEHIEQETHQEIQLLEDLELDNLEEKLENTQENSVIFLENTAFHPGEFGFSVTREGHITHYDYSKILEFRKQLASCSEVLINDCVSERNLMETSLQEDCAVSNAGCSSVLCAEYSEQAVMGLRLENEVKGISSIFFEPDRPILALLGRNDSSRTSELDIVVMAYSLIDVVDKIFIGGTLALTFLAFLGQLALPFDTKLGKFIQRTLDYARERAVEIILPEDFLIAEHSVVPEDSPSEFTWAHFAESFSAIGSSEGVPEGCSVVAFGECTKQRLSETLLITRRIYWCGSLDLHSSSRGELNALNFTCFDFIRTNKEAKEITVVIQDVESALYKLILQEEDTAEELEEETGKISKTASAASLEFSGAAQLLSPQEKLDSLVDFKLSGGKFTVALLQGRLIKPLMLLAEHPPPKQKTIDDDLSYLDAI